MTTFGIPLKIYLVLAAYRYKAGVISGDFLAKKKK